MDATVLILIALVLAGLAITVVYFVRQMQNGDVKTFQPGDQEGKKSVPGAPTLGTQRANKSKTAQLSALRDRLTELQGQTPIAPGSSVDKGPAKKAAAIPTTSIEQKTDSWNPTDAGLGEGFFVDPNWGDGSKEQEKAPSLAKEDSPRPSQAAPQEQKVVPAAGAQPQPEQAFMPSLPDDGPLLPQLPGIPEQEPSVDASVSSGQSSGGGASSKAAYHTGPARILLVDDSKVVRIKTEKLLLSGGYQVCCAVDGLDALAKLESFSADLIVTDIEMPNLDGFGLVRNVRGNESTAEIPIIVMTSHVNLHLDIAATEGINGFLPKPFNDQDMLDQVEFLTN